MSENGGAVRNADDGFSASSERITIPVVDETSSRSDDCPTPSSAEVSDPRTEGKIVCSGENNVEPTANNVIEISKLEVEVEETTTVGDSVQISNMKLEVEESDSPEKKMEANDNKLTEISKLELEVQKRTHERDNYQKKLDATEKRMAALQASYNAVTNSDSDEITLRREMEDLKNMLTQAQLMLQDRGRLIANQETQINALNKQVSSLKEVVAITKDLLNIRNMEVKHLQKDVDSMESRIGVERDRHNAMMSKMDAAVCLNADLKKEYETQLRLFQDLRGKYEQKVTLLSEENKALEAAAQPAVQ